MDAPTPSAQPTFASRTPLHIGAVGLTVRDLDAMAGYYRRMLGLSVLDRSGDRAVLGAGGVPFLQLEQNGRAKPDDPREAGLYHTAFLMPTRADLARWILHIARERIPISGASDHTVSEAFYLDDPEGNGVEVYVDREVDQAAGYSDAPGGLRIGHIHLRVGSVDALERFYQDGVGFKVTRGGRHGASFMSSGRYHHHLAGNVWHSRGAGRRDPDRTGLAWFAIEATDPGDIGAISRKLANQGTAVSPIDGGVEAIDPWGTRVRFVQA
jgi:catechol 2,3-dioxygenase